MGDEALLAAACQQLGHGRAARLEIHRPSRFRSRSTRRLAWPPSTSTPGPWPSPPAALRSTRAPAASAAAFAAAGPAATFGAAGFGGRLGRGRGCRRRLLGRDLRRGRLDRGGLRRGRLGRGLAAVVFTAIAFAGAFAATGFTAVGFAAAFVAAPPFAGAPASAAAAFVSLSSLPRQLLLSPASAGAFISSSSCRRASCSWWTVRSRSPTPSVAPSSEAALMSASRSASCSLMRAIRSRTRQTRRSSRSVDASGPSAARADRGEHAARQVGRRRVEPGHELLQVGRGIGRDCLAPRVAERLCRLVAKRQPLPRLQLPSQRRAEEQERERLTLEAAQPHLSVRRRGPIDGGPDRNRPAAPGQLVAQDPLVDARQLGELRHVGVLLDLSGSRRSRSSMRRV